MTRRNSASIAQRQEARRAELLDVAMALVEERGLVGLTAASLAEATGSVPAALYRTFASMDELKGALVARALDVLHDAIAEAIARVDGDDACVGTDEHRCRALRRVWAMTWVLPTMRTTDPARHRLIDHALSAPEQVFGDDVAHAVEQRLQRALSPMHAALREAVQTGALHDDATPLSEGVRTLALLAVVHGVDHLQKRDRLEPAGRHAVVVLGAAVRALLVGWGADPSLVVRATSSIARA